ncbi:CDF family Co(II)/Ni(II) efflux transporter DmeF [Piscinibacter sp.]|uniref:CDF family Co(II)/Ni(II) efflux transporter DmeF n=1 Tax=Piscinibacter sp. TaxID=1903157 RepID=UPI002BFDC449|nr:CDF family Co(II)/Ni(II) efflux transporter DmeF [Albitalea sp.]HUG21575.1 CDF family Co(II)/Ni(II) efflux transporter DmeF [Albitalea sp.]
MASARSRPHAHDLSPWQHGHQFDAGNRSGEARTRWVLALTLVTMLAEIGAGWWTGSMALLADGWHMGTHALALAVAALAYWLARRHAHDARFAFGTWKIEVLGSFASAVVLAVVALGIAAESVLRLWRSEPIAVEAALAVAVIGLAVNLVSAWLLHGAEHGGHEHPHDGHDHDHDHDHGHHDLNLRAAYVHVLTDALTSVLAIGALAGAWWLGWWWLDPMVGVLGAVVIAVWAVGLMRDSSAVLLDREMDHPLARRIREDLESDGDAKVADLHLWRVGRDQFAAIACLVADAPLAPSAYRERLQRHRQLAHVSLEVNRCPRSPDEIRGSGAG